MDGELLGRQRARELSSDEENSDDEGCYGSDDRSHTGVDDIQRAASSGVTMGGAKTGPKGVIQDYKRYKQLQQEQKQAEEQRKLKYIKDTAITCRSEKEDQEDEDLEEDDDFLREYHQKRLQQLKVESEQYVLGTRSKFSVVHELTCQDFIEAVDNVDVHVTVIILIYENSPLCSRMNTCFDCLAQQYPYVKFCRIGASEAGLSTKFKLNALPTLQVYKNGILIGNHIRLGDHFESEFYAADVENFLIEHDALPSQEFNAANPVVMPSSIDDLSDSDFELD
ncbi:phosducin-like protein [Rhopilema esculentum]|uniref:phosducin-like protein n=1 Tax=Rhopilema esculentum TaxID=499914 RepID=UPI0031CE2E10